MGTALTFVFSAALDWEDNWDLVLLLPLTPIVTLDSCSSSTDSLFLHLQNEDVEIEL